MGAAISLFRRRVGSERVGRTAQGQREGKREGQRGRRATGWWGIAVNLKNDIKHDAVGLLAAGVAFYALLALVPTLVALVSLYGLVADPSDIERTVDDLLAAAPTEVQDLVRSQLSAIVESSASGLKVGALAGLAAALWSASSGMKHLMTAVNRGYHQTETRGYVKLRGTSLVLTVGLMVLGAAALFGLVIGPQALDRHGATGVARDVLMVARWPLLGAVIVVGLAILYRFAPDHDEPRWSWASAGAVVAAAVWLLSSLGFTLYTANFGKYNETYGALGAVVVVMLWLYIGAFAVIAGAELNGQLAEIAAVGARRRAEAGPARN
jgi:membrane protein